MHKTLIAFTLILCCFCSNANATATHQDSIFGNRMLDSLNCDLFRIDGEIILPFEDSLTSQERHKLDSLKADWRTEYYHWNVAGPQDGAFRIFSFFGQGCGAYCNGWVSSFLVYHKNGIKVVEELLLEGSPSLTEWKNPKGQAFYLLISNGGVRTDCCNFNSTYTACLLSSQNENIVFCPFYLMKSVEPTMYLETTVNSADYYCEGCAEKELIVLSDNQFRLTVTEYDPTTQKVSLLYFDFLDDRFVLAEKEVLDHQHEDEEW